MSQQAHRALLVIDVQNEYISGNLRIEFPETPLSLTNIGLAMDAANKANIPIVVVQQDAPIESPLFAHGSEGWKLHDVVRTRHYHHYLEKQFPSAFTGTDLAQWLKIHQIDTLTVVGYMTHNCIDSTIRHAFHTGYSVEFLSDAAGSLPYINKAGTASAEEIHRIFSVVMHSNFAAVMKTNEWTNILHTNQAADRDNIFSSNQRACKAKKPQPNIGWANSTS